MPLDGRLEDSLKFKFDRAGKPLAEVLDEKGMDAIRARLTTRDSQRRGEAATVSLLYPLAVNNLLTACMNHAAGIGAPRVSADVVMAV